VEISYNSLYFGLVGAIGGLTVASWHGYKDTPWEGFFPKRFARSPFIGAFVGLFLYSLDKQGWITIDNLGILALSTICLERFIGEFLKGFFKREVHKEYISAFKQYNFPYTKYFIKLIIGLFGFAAISLLLGSFVLLP